MFPSTPTHSLLLTLAKDSAEGTWGVSALSSLKHAGDQSLKDRHWDATTFMAFVQKSPSLALLEKQCTINRIT